MQQQVETIAKLALSLANKYMAPYGAVRSRKDFTQAQLMACLVLRAYWKTTYRGLIENLNGQTQLRAILGMEDHLPHYTTVQKFSERSKVLEILNEMLQCLGKAAIRHEKSQVVAAMDSTGMEAGTASAHFVSRSGKERNRWVKVSVIVLGGSLLPLSANFDWGPSNDKTQAPKIIEPMLAGVKPDKLYADAGYDAEWIHGLCRDHGVQTVIKPARCAADGSRSGENRSKMSDQYLKQQKYGQRWLVETYMSGLKRTTGSALTARKPQNLLIEAAIRVFAYALRR